MKQKTVFAESQFKHRKYIFRISFLNAINNITLNGT